MRIAPVLPMTRKMMGLAVVVLLSTAAGCGGRPDISKEGLGRDCPAAGCAEGQQCVARASSEGDTHTCEIPCESDSDCPQSLRCNTSPLPDSIPDVCIE